jgi:hypothetical protein
MKLICINTDNLSDMGISLTLYKEYDIEPNYLDDDITFSNFYFLRDDNNKFISIHKDRFGDKSELREKKLSDIGL